MHVSTRAYTGARWKFRYSNVMTTGLMRATFMSAVARRRHELFIGIMLLAELTHSLSVKCDKQVDFAVGRRPQMSRRCYVRHRSQWLSRRLFEQGGINGT